MGWTFHLLGLGGYLAVALAVSTVNGFVNSRGGYLSFGEAFRMLIVAWSVGMSAFYGVMAVLLESGLL